MKNLSYIFLLMLLPVLGFSQISGEREVIANGGDHATTANLEVSWTVGEVAVTTASTPNLVVTQGFHQGDANLSGREDDTYADYFEVYPNPVRDQLTIAARSDNPLQVQGQVFDLTGRMVMDIPSFQVAGTWQGQVDMSRLPAGQWLLRFDMPGTGQSKSFMVTKVK